MKKNKKKLCFTDLETNETWWHNFDGWILCYCNFNSSIHPSVLRTGQKITVTDVKGHRVLIEARLEII